MPPVPKQAVETPLGFERVSIAQDPEPVEAPRGFERVERVQSTLEKIRSGFAENRPDFIPSSEKGIVSRTFGQLLGTNRDDPLEFERLGSILAGTLAGARVGSQIPGPPQVKAIATLGGSFVGMLAGVIAPEQFLETGETMGIFEPGTRERLGLTPDELNATIADEMLLEAFTGGALATLRLTGRGVGRLLTGVGKAERELAERAAILDLMLMPVQIGRSSIGRGYVAVMGRIPLIGGSIPGFGKGFKTRALEAEKVLEGRILGLPDRLGPLTAWSTVSEEIFTDAKNLVGRFNDEFNIRYEDVYKRADEAGVISVPKRSLRVGREILEQILEQTPKFIKGQGGEIPGVIVKKVSDFINSKILPMASKSQVGGEVFRNQTLREMDGLLSSIDQEIASLDPATRRFAQSLFTKLRVAVQWDVLHNIRATQVPGELASTRAGAAQQVAADLRQVDIDFSKGLSQLFDTATAKSIGKVTKKGIRARVFNPNTTTPIDQLARFVVDLKSPQAIEELHRIIEPETFERIVSRVFGDAADKAIKAGGTAEFGRFDIEAFATQLGLSGSRGEREALGEMLRLSKSNIGLEELDTLVEVGRRMANFDIPNASVFIARRVTIGGVRALINGFVPNLAVAGGAATGAFAGGTLLGSAFLLGGGRLVTAIISNPDSSRALIKVLDKEANRLVRRQAFIDVLRIGLEEIKSDFEQIRSARAPRLRPTFKEISKVFDELIEVLDQQAKSFEELLEEQGITVESGEDEK